VRALFQNLNLEAYRRFISMLAFSSGEVLNMAKLASSLSVSEPTVKHYLEIAEGTFLWRRLNSYQSSHKKRLIKSPKGYLRDSGLINYFLKIESKGQLLGHPNYGFIWESFVIEQIIKSLNRKLLHYDVYFYRTKHGTGIDLLIETARGLIPVEIKSGDDISHDSLKHLKQFIEEYKCEYGLVINNSDRVVKLSEQLIQLPAKCL
jgi:predicted AAA+ superfamily ATPase